MWVVELHRDCLQYLTQRWNTAVPVVAPPTLHQGPKHPEQGTPHHPGAPEQKGKKFRGRGIPRVRTRPRTYNLLHLTPNQQQEAVLTTQQVQPHSEAPPVPWQPLPTQEMHSQRWPAPSHQKGSSQPLEPRQALAQIWVIFYEWTTEWPHTYGLFLLLLFVVLTLPVPLSPYTLSCHPLCSLFQKNLC
jgi:hypothetical protein